MSNIAFANNGRIPAIALSDAPVHDVSAVLARVASELEELQLELRQAAESSRREIPAPSPEIALHAGTDTNLQISIRHARKIRGLRKRLFGEDLFSGPPWDILLVLFESYATQRRDTICNVYDDTGIAPATATRWINRLVQADFVRVRDDPLDRRRRFVELSHIGVQAMTDYFNGIAPHLLAA
jgi:DNA-binding MarR family transcriptional regulator